jgi:hypothetical protein
MPVISDCKFQAKQLKSLARQVALVASPMADEHWFQVDAANFMVSIYKLANDHTEKTKCSCWAQAIADETKGEQ